MNHVARLMVGVVAAATILVPATSIADIKRFRAVGKDGVCSGMCGKVRVRRR